MAADYGVESGSFTRGRNWFAIHLSVRDSKANSRAIGRQLEPEDYDLLNDNGLYSERFESRPVPLEGDEDFTGIQTCRLAFLAAQTALDTLYNRGDLAGFRQKLEVALSLCPTRGLPHAHAVADSGETNPQYLADELFSEMQKTLALHRAEMSVDLYPSVRVFAIPSPTDLLRCIRYLEKIIPFGLLTEEVLNRDGTQDPDGLPNHRVFKQLESSLLNLPDQLKQLSGGFRAYQSMFYWLQRRRSLGNMRCGKHFVGLEPDWHRWQRQRNALKQAERRARKANEDFLPSKTKHSKMRKIVDTGVKPSVSAQPATGTPVYGPQQPVQRIARRDRRKHPPNRPP